MEPVVVDFKSFVFLHRPNRMYAAKMSTYLKVGENERYAHFVTMASGQIELVRVPRAGQLVNELVPYNKFSLKHAAEVYLGTTLEISTKAKRALQNVLRSQDLSRTDFLPVLDKDKLNKPTRQERQQDRANEITLEKICQSLKLDPKRVRGLFRDNDIKKPGNRWTWNKAEGDKITKLVQRLVKENP